MTTVTTTRSTTFRWLAKQIGTMNGMTYTSDVVGHFVEKARKVVKANPQNVRELADTLVNFEEMKGYAINRREQLALQNVLNAMQGRRFVEELY